MDDALYTDLHVHASRRHRLEIIAYERRDGGWDVFVSAGKGECPELEPQRVDEWHIFIAHIAVPQGITKLGGEAVSIERNNAIDMIGDQVDARVGEGYDHAVYYRERGSRKLIGRIQSHLLKSGAGGVQVGRAYYGTREPSEDWELVIRKRDFPVAAQILDSNISSAE